MTAPGPDGAGEPKPIRRALVIGVSTFPRVPLASGSLPTTPPVFEDLLFVPQRVEAVATSLRQRGYDVVGGTLLNPDHDRMWQAVQECLDDQAATCGIIHVVSHGVDNPRQRERLDAVPADGNISTMMTNVTGWVSDATMRERPTLFLLDLCFSGRVAQLEFLQQIRPEDRSVHVIAAAWSDEAAYNAYFSDVVASVLDASTVDGLGANSLDRYVPLQLFFREVSDAVRRVSRRGQQVSASTLSPGSHVEFPFLDNPNYVGYDPLTDLQRTVDPAVRSFLDDATFGAKHFAERVGRHFAGRSAELARLVPWLRGVGAGPCLTVVTGSPGVGKSALLGRLVCASHPALAGLDARYRDLEGFSQQTVEPFAAVHARQRRYDDLIGSIARQLGLPGAERGMTPSRLIEEITRLPHPPTVVLDALDESPEPDNVVAVLLLPLVRAFASVNGRLLVGVRPWLDDFPTLFSTAAELGVVVNLDDVATSVLEADLRDFLRRFLTDAPYYGDRAWPREQLVRGIAARLAAARCADPDAATSGSFLVASLYALHLSKLAGQGHPGDVEWLIEHVPLTLAEVLELDLQGMAHADRVRPVLATLAEGRGEGMPLSVVQEVAPTLAEGGRLVPAQVRQTLDEHARFYLRTSVDRDGSDLYRLFHQGLADYLSEHPFGPPEGTAL